MGTTEPSTSGGVTVCLPDGTFTSSFTVAFERTGGRVEWERFDPATGTAEEWECHFSICLKAGADGNQYLPQYDKPPVLLHSSRAWDVL